MNTTDWKRLKKWLFKTVGLCSKSHLHNLCKLSNSISLAANKRLQKIESQMSKMATWKIFWITLVFVAVHFRAITWAANVALFKPITASATCGLSEVEEYYSVRERYKSLRDRDLSYCDASNASLSHNASDMVDGELATWWQAPSSVGNVSITIDLRGEHQKVSPSENLRFSEIICL